MAASNRAFAPNALRRRLLSDIAEMQQDPYPNVHLYVDDKDIRKACVILTPESHEPLHLFIEFGNECPLYAPSVSIQSNVVHPNVFGDYICAAILNTSEGWTPTYKLKGVLIQLLSFFSSESLEQDNGGHADDNKTDGYFCDGCGFGPAWRAASISRAPEHAMKALPATVSKLLALPDEVVLLMLEEMPTNDVLALAHAIPFVGHTIHSFEFIRTRELQCFCLKKSYLDAKLGIGISVSGGSRPVSRSEFDLLSQEAFFQYDVHRSIQGVKFNKWLPLPLSRRHWNTVRTTATACLRSIHNHGRTRCNEPGDIDVVYYLMNNVVVQFSADAERGLRRPDGRSTLSHASEKAVEAYFACFHPILCLATEDITIFRAANRMVDRFLTGPHTKQQFPDLGHILVAALVSDDRLTQLLILKTIQEAILRNVVWMLDSKGADMAELACMEPSSVSDYRLIKTFEASKASYRLLMFLKLFSSSARPAGKPLTDLREALFDSHGAPPPGVFTALARRIREIREISGFSGFLRAMGIEDVPGKTEFTAFLRRTVTDSVKAGYSIMPLSQSELYMIRKVREVDVEIAQGVKVDDNLIAWYNKGEQWWWNGWRGRPTFFPQRETTKRQNGRDGARRCGRGGRDG